jgi:hypothetical protein
MHVVEQHESCGGDRADPPGAEADPAQRLEGGLEQGVPAFGRGAGGRVQQVDGVALVGLVFSVSWVLERASLTPADPFEGVQTWLVGHPLHVAAAVAVLALVARLLAPRPAIRAVRPAQAR